MRFTRHWRQLESQRVAPDISISRKLSTIRSDESAVIPDRNESALLDLELCWLEPQDDLAIATQVEIGRAFPDAFGDHYRSLTNLCRQLHSLRRLWSLLELLGVDDDDLVLLLRPDLLYLDALDPASQLRPLIDGLVDLIVPGWQNWGGLNDRFAFCTGRAARVYANRMEWFAEGCVSLGTMHGESFLGFLARYQHLHVGLTDLRAVRMRANGQIPAAPIGRITKRRRHRFDRLRTTPAPPGQCAAL